jgi:hypothetical protein
VDHTAVILDGTEFGLSSGQDVARLQADALSAAQGEGAYVRFRLEGGTEMAAMIMPTTHVVFSTEQGAYAAVDSEPNSHQIYFDLNLWDLSSTS